MSLYNRFQFILPIIFSLLVGILYGTIFLDNFFNLGLNSCSSIGVVCFGILDVLLIILSGPALLIDVNAGTGFLYIFIFNIALCCLLGYLIDWKRSRSYINVNLGKKLRYLFPIIALLALFIIIAIPIKNSCSLPISDIVGHYNRSRAFQFPAWCEKIPGLPRYIGNFIYGSGGDIYGTRCEKDIVTALDQSNSKSVCSYVVKDVNWEYSQYGCEFNCN